MSQLIALVIAIVLGAVVTAIGYVFLGGTFADQSTKAEAQKILVQAEQIEAAMIAYKVDNGGVIKLGESTDFDNNEIFSHLVEDGYLKSNINDTITEKTHGWHLSGDGGDGVCDTGDNCSIQRIVPESDQCIEANFQRNRYPKEGLQAGDLANNGSHTVLAGEIQDGVPDCSSDIEAACCVDLTT